MATEGENTSPSGADMFDAAFERPEAPAQEQPAEQPAQAQEPSGDRPRDDKGRFAPKAEDAPAQAQQPPAAPPPQAQQQDHRVPLTELLNEREKRQQYERERDQFRQQAEAFQQKLAQFQQQQAHPPEPPPDVLENPQGFAGHLQTQLQQEFHRFKVGMSLEAAHDAHGEKFEAAYAAALQAKAMGDPAVMAILNAPNPGKALMRWHESRNLYETTGGNLDGWLAKKQEEWLKDPAIQAKAIELARQAQTPQPNSQRAPVVELPPSLTRTPGSSAASASSASITGQELFDQAFAR